MGLVQAAIDPGDQQIAFGRALDNRKARRVFDFVQSPRRRKAALAVLHSEANIGAGLVAFFAGDRPNDKRSLIISKGDLRSVLFSLHRLDAAVDALLRGPSLAAVGRPRDDRV